MAKNEDFLKWALLAAGAYFAYTYFKKTGSNFDIPIEAAVAGAGYITPGSGTVAIPDRSQSLLRPGDIHFTIDNGAATTTFGINYDELTRYEKYLVRKGAYHITDEGILSKDPIKLLMPSRNIGYINSAGVKQKALRTNNAIVISTGDAKGTIVTIPKTAQSTLSPGRILKRTISGSGQVTTYSTPAVGKTMGAAKSAVSRVKKFIKKLRK